MAHNSLFPGFVRLRYSGATYTHVMTLPVNPTNPVLPGIEPLFARRDGTDALMSVVVLEFVTLAKALVGSATTFIDAEYWQMADETADPVWTYTVPLAVIGTGTTASVPSTQSVLSFRTNQGGIYFNYLLEIIASITPNVRQNPPYAPAAVQSYSAYIAGTTSWITGRDGGYPISALWHTTKVNDAIRKKQLNL